VELYNKKILIADNERDIAKLLKTRLSSLGYKTFLASNGNEALTNFTNHEPDLVLLDVMLPKLDGYEVCRKIRATSSVPIIILTALGNISNRVLGLELGADDYVIKPFSPKELEARIKSALRRSSLKLSKLPKVKTQLQIGNFVVDINTKIILKRNLKIKLTEIEYNLLELLIRNTGKNLSRITILNNVWGYTPERYIDTRIVDVHISRLRSKIEENPSKPDLIVTVRGIGYMAQPKKNS